MIQQIIDQIITRQVSAILPNRFPKNPYENPNFFTEV